MGAAGSLFELSADRRQCLERALEALPKASVWEVEHLALQQLQHVDAGDACRLVLRAAVYLREAPGTQRAQLELQLTSSPWRPTRALPALAGSPDDSAPVAGAESTVLHYVLTDVQPKPLSHPRSSAWLHYVDSSIARYAAVDAQWPVSVQIESVLPIWLRKVLSLDTVEGVQEALLSGPVGHFGPVEKLVLERTGQTDLAVEATLLAEADDAPETASDPSLLLSLMGERFGLWLLYRRQAKVLKPARKDAPAPKEWTCSVQVAESAEALIAQCALTPAEKRLFQSAGCLSHATLWANVDHAVEDEAPGDGHSKSTTPEAARTTSLDLSGMEDRSRQQLQAIVQLAQQGKLATGDIDLLLRTARHLARGKGGARSSLPLEAQPAKRR